MSQISNGESRPWALSLSIQVSDREKCCGGCEFCISRTTPGTSIDEGPIKQCDLKRLGVGLNYANRLGATHTILTSKADPTQEDPVYLCNLVRTAREHLPLVDMHTNGLLLQKGSKSNLLENLVEAGLTMVTFSIASFEERTNNCLMHIPQQPKELIAKALDLGLLVRCSLVVNKQGARSIASVLNYIYEVGNLGAHMVVVREIWIPETADNKGTSVLDWNRNNHVDILPIQQSFIDISNDRNNSCGLQMRDPLPWGTPVFVLDGKFKDPNHGVNITFARCDEANTGQIWKSIVHKPNGHGYRNWDSNGDILY